MKFLKPMIMMAVVVALAGCGGQAGKLVGKWKIKDAPEDLKDHKYIEFSKKGKVIFSSDGYSEEYDYIIYDKNKLSIGSRGHGMVIKFDIDDDEFTGAYLSRYEDEPKQFRLVKE